jgi:hypothetical protein
VAACVFGKELDEKLTKLEEFDFERILIWTGGGDSESKGGVTFSTAETPLAVTNNYGSRPGRQSDAMGSDGARKFIHRL